MELHRYDIIEAELDYGTGSIQKKRRLFIVKLKCRKLQTKNVGDCNYIL